MASLECNHPTCSGAHCRRPKKEKEPYRIKPVSLKRKEINKIYGPKAAAFREANPRCVINSPWCKNHEADEKEKTTEGVHHVKGKHSTQMLLDEDYWLPACNPCNNYIESHPEWATANGFKLPDYGRN
jgi:hypothetical protein